jgi:predicted aminopeptidase
MKLARSVLIVSCLVTGACSSVGYYAQSIAGQTELISKRRPVSDIINDPATHPQLKQKLTELEKVLEYAWSELDLPDNGSYRHYADLQREYVVWNVFAAPEFSLQPSQWCYLVVGCVNYRGYFKEQDALDYARQLSGKGLEVAVGGVAAYSTLGWFKDPLLNSMLQR